ncbi:unnamed protein product [Arabidopsis lyrata]|uniref:zinc finger protein on ecdysone puffs n=1 Tax=Arabidopsis lyrata subsp. lyrata TaxID=81972 RepID=UPI000A29C417|nr:zinc finger protein on ecdysone puffs [Arabidopsis lyrata subsp. lyrata]CAH8253385.1 unnamed protein product [Arabidopsis lyrata]|eukprot:XP_020869433.1 zinc finger protein on ecdysone puffs [Arabidopsis lyrata subsp. lyrata]
MPRKKQANPRRSGPYGNGTVEVLEAPRTQIAVEPPISNDVDANDLDNLGEESEHEAEADHEVLEADHESEAEADHESEAEADHESEPEADHESEPEADHESEAEADHEPEPIPEPVEPPRLREIRKYQSTSDLRVSRVLFVKSPKTIGPI